LEIRRERKRREAETQRGGWEAEKKRCAEDILYWWDKWVFTYDPRLVGKPSGPYVPFKLWPKQRDFILWLKDRFDHGEEGLGEKSRDVGVTYLCAGFALHHWQFVDGFKATFGSRKVDYVDKKGNPDAIFT